MGDPRFEMADHLRSFHAGRYVVFYLPSNGAFDVVQIIHGSRDIPVHFRTPRS
jgi:plasmid stabilization system protein ParE